MSSPANKAANKTKKAKDAAASKPKLFVRRARLSDVPAIYELGKKVYAPLPSLNERMIRGQINNFPEGQFVAEYDGKVVGHCATFIIGEDIAFRPHTWHEITGNGMASRHDGDGEQGCAAGATRTSPTGGSGSGGTAPTGPAPRAEPSPGP